MVKVVVTGSLGNIGQYLVGWLVKNGHSVTVVTSSEDRRKAIEDLGAKAAVGSAEDAQFLTTTFKGHDIAFTLIPPSYTAPDFRARYLTVSKNYAQAIQEAGIKRIVNLSSIGAHTDNGIGLLNCFKAIEQGYNNIPGASVSHIRPSYFYTNLDRFFGLVASKGVIVANYGGSDTIPLVHPKDIAEVALAEIEAPLDSSNKVTYVTSDERTGDEVASLLGAAIGKPDLKWVVCTDEQAKKAAMDAGMNDENSNQYTELGASMRNSAVYDHYYQNKPAFGKIKLEEYAKEWATKYQNAASKK